MPTLTMTKRKSAKDMDPRQRILARLKEMGKSNYWLAEQLRGQMSQNSIYSFLRGETEITSAKLGKMCDVLGLDLLPVNER